MDNQVTGGKGAGDNSVSGKRGGGEMDSERTREIEGWWGCRRHQRKERGDPLLAETQERNDARKQKSAGIFHI